MDNTNENINNEINETEEILEENVTPRKKVCVHFTHNDADALGCAIMQSFATEYDTHTFFCDYSDIDQVVRDYFTVDPETKVIPDLFLITDLSITEETAKMLENIHDYCLENQGHEMKLLLVDHHETNKLMKFHPWCIVTSKDSDGKPISACKLMFTAMGSTLDPRFVPILISITNKISSYDTWEWKKDPNEKGDAEYFNIIIKERGIEEATQQVLNGITESEFTWGEENLKLIRNYINKRTIALGRILDNVAFVRYEEYLMGIIFPDQKYFNESLEIVYNEYPDIDIVVGLNPEKRQISLRSNKDDVNLGRFAKYKFGGGGHKQAAGAYLNTKDFLDLLKSYYDSRDKAIEIANKANETPKHKYSLNVANEMAIKALKHCKDTKLARPSILFTDLITEHLRPVLEEVLSENRVEICKYMLALVRGVLHDWYIEEKEIREDIDVTAGGIETFLNQFYVVTRQYDENGNEMGKEEIPTIPEETDDINVEAEEIEDTQTDEETSKEIGAEGKSDVEDDEIDGEIFEDVIDCLDNDSDSDEDNEGSGIPEDGVLYEDLFGGPELAEEGKIE